MQKKTKITETLANGYSYESTRQELSNEYQDDRVSMVFQELFILVLGTKVVSALEGLNIRARNKIFFSRESNCIFVACKKTLHLWAPCRNDLTILFYFIFGLY